jgi:hypothetical protein
MEFFKGQPWVAILFGTALVAVGGFVATWGWNQVSELRSERSMLLAATYEWSQNDLQIKTALDLAKRWSSRKQSENFSYQSYKAQKLNTLLATGSQICQKRSFAKEAREYENAIDRFNSGLRIVGRHNPGMFLGSDYIHTNDPDMPKEESILLSKSFRLLVSAHRNFGRLLN